MERLDELIKILSEASVNARYGRARATKTCKICGRSARNFRNAACAFEYRVSAICQYCQDKYLSASTGCDDEFACRHLSRLKVD